jgi:hypothetical protein
VVTDLSLLHSFQTGSGAYPATYPVSTMGSFPGTWSWLLSSIYCRG